MSIWNVAWVAHALTTAPDRLFHANIFYPHRYTLAFSEANIGAGALAVPAWWLTANPYLAHNVVVLIAFTLSSAGMYFLVHYLTGRAGPAAIAGLTFAYCPYIFARTAHIQLLMTAGLPFSLLAFHRLADAPSAGRGIALGLVLAGQALSCAYYGIFAALLMGLGVVVFAPQRWRNPRYWAGTAIAAAVAIGVVLPFFMPYLRLQRESGFQRTLEEASMYSANWQAYLASGAWAHRWSLRYLEGFSEVLFPGLVATTLGFRGAALALPASLMNRFVGHRSNTNRAVPRFYILAGLIAAWISFGPSAGLFAWLYRTVPVFSFLQAPARFGLLISLSLSVLAGLALAYWVDRLERGDTRSSRSGRRRGAVICVGLFFVAGAELTTAPLNLADAPALPAVYRTLATLPRAPVVELPFFYRRSDFPRHALYMLNSTSHWFPLVNGYSDHIPADFRQMVIPVSSFPTRESFRILRARRTRYAIFHLDFYDRPSRERLMHRIEQYAPFLRLLARDGDVWLYEIIDWP